MLQYHSTPQCPHYSLSAPHSPPIHAPNSSIKLSRRINLDSNFKAKHFLRRSCIEAEAQCRSSEDVPELAFALGVREREGRETPTQLAYFECFGARYRGLNASSIADDQFQSPEVS